MRRLLRPHSQPLSADAPKRAVRRRRLILGAVAGVASVGIAASVVSAATGDGGSGPSGPRMLSRQFDLQAPGYPPLHAHVQVTVGQGTTKPDACRMVPERGYVNYPLLMTITNTGSQEWHDSFGGASPKPYLDLTVSDESSDHQTRGEEEIQVPDREITDECHSFHELGDSDLNLAAHQSFSYQLTVPSLSPDPSKVVFRLGTGAFEGDSDSKAVWTVHLDGHGATFTVPPNRRITPPSLSPSSPTAAPTLPVGVEPTVPAGPLCAFLARYYEAQPPYPDQGHGRVFCTWTARAGVSMEVLLTQKDPQTVAFGAARSTSTPPTPSPISGPFVAVHCQNLGVGYDDCVAATQVVPGSTVLVEWVYGPSAGKRDPEQLFRDTTLRIASELKQYCGTTCPTA